MGREEKLMKRVLVTGAAGFVGSHLVDYLLASGMEVVGIDSIDPYYDATVKRHNLALAREHHRFRYIEGDLLAEDLHALLDGVAYVFHLAGQPGVRASWGESFSQYTRNNINATQRLLEAATACPIEKLVFASTSSVYGDVGPSVLQESSPSRPLSPYGVTKQAAEGLCLAYACLHHVPTVVLRYFTIYGPRQRPDMAFYRFIRCALAGDPINLYGSGQISRDFTYIDDAVAATVLAADLGRPAHVYNVASGRSVSLLEVVCVLEGIVERPLTVHLTPSTPKGDMVRTEADTTRARDHLGYTAGMDLAAGLARQVEWMSAHRGGGVS